MSSAVSTYREEFGDPTKLEDEGVIPFGEVFQYSLGLVGRHVFVGFEVIGEAITLLDHVDALVAKVTDDEHVRWEHEAKEGDPEPGTGHACQDSGKDGLRNEEDRERSHQGHLLDEGHRCLHADTSLGDLERNVLKAKESFQERRRRSKMMFLSLETARSTAMRWMIGVSVETDVVKDGRKRK